MYLSVPTHERENPNNVCRKSFKHILAVDFYKYLVVLAKYIVFLNLSLMGIGSNKISFPFLFIPFIRNRIPKNKGINRREGKHNLNPFE